MDMALRDGMKGSLAEVGAHADDDFIELCAGELGEDGERQDLARRRVFIGDADPSVTRAAPFLHLSPLPIWLTAPEALRHTPRIRRVFDALAAHFRALKLDPAPPIG